MSKKKRKKKNKRAKKRIKKINRKKRKLKSIDKTKSKESKELVFKVPKKWSSTAYINKSKYEKLSNRNPSRVKQQRMANMKNSGWLY